MPDLYDNQDSLDQLEDGSNLTDQASSVGSSFVTGKQREKAAQLAKQWIHQFIDAAIEDGIKGVISTFAAPVAIFAILVTAVPLCLVSVKYLLNMSADPVTDAVRDAVHEAYDDVKKDSVIMNNLNMSYGCEFTRLPFAYFLPVLKDESFQFLEEEPMPNGFGIGDIIL